MPQRHRGLAPLVVVLAVLLGSVIVFIQSHEFYFWDDSAAVFLPTWYTVGTDLWQGHWPTLRPDLWMGGNLAAEAQFGLWNPVNLMMMMIVAKIPDMAVSAFIIKAFWQVMLAMGGFLLAREYGAKPWPAAAMAVALPFAGFTLYYDTSSWIAGLMATVWTAWFWWAAHRVLNGTLNPFIGFIFGYLLITNGNPYGALSAVIVLMGLALEAVLQKHYRALWKLVLMGGLVGSTALVAYLPLLLSSDVGWRTTKGIINDGFLAPNSLMLMATSTSSMLPNIVIWTGQGSSVPVTYSAWFLLPILPWLNWPILRTKVKQMAGLWLFFAVYLLLVLGPSQIWLFRWPVRLLEYLWLTLFVIIAVVLSHGLRTSAWKLRAAGSFFIIFVGAVLAFLMAHELVGRHLTALAVQSVLVALMIFLALKHERFLPGLLIVGTLTTLVLQIIWVPYNDDVSKWWFPSDTAVADYGERIQGPVLQIAEGGLSPLEERGQASEWLLFGNIPAVSGVESTASYSGIGFSAFSVAMCINHAGSTCDLGLLKAFRIVRDTDVPVVDAMRINTIVVENDLVKYAPEYEPPMGWRKTESNDWVTIFVREEPLDWPDSRLSIAEGTSVASAVSTDTSDTLTVSTEAIGGSLTFARLAWPGYRAEVNGEQVPVSTNAIGLVQVDLPGDLTDAEVNVTFTVPGYNIAVPVLVVAVLAAAAQGLFVAKHARSRWEEASE